jgi:hypothetical protein
MCQASNASRCSKKGSASTYVLCPAFRALVALNIITIRTNPVANIIARRNWNSQTPTGQAYMLSQYLRSGPTVSEILANGLPNRSVTETEEDMAAYLQSIDKAMEKGGVTD